MGFGNQTISSLLKTPVPDMNLRVPDIHPETGIVLFCAFWCKFILNCTLSLPPAIYADISYHQKY